jgi:predicted Ser/Thr protein kinase
VGNPAFHELLVGRRLAERYRVDGVLGRGGMSVVYLAFDQVLEREVALKVIDLPAVEGEGRSDLRARFRREAAAAARIGTHPHVVQVHDFGTDAELDLDFIVMERLRGQDLKSAMQRGVDSERARRIVLEAARGVAAGHRAGLVHRDVKTGNVFLVGEGELEGVRVLDFGIAKALDPSPSDDLTRTAVTPHSPAYASPEQLRGLPVGPPSDVYQLGLMAYELFAGERAFDDLDRERMRAGEAVELRERGRWGSLEPHLRRELERALAFDAANRHADAAELAEALASAEARRGGRSGEGEETELHQVGDVTLLDPGVREVPAAEPRAADSAEPVPGGEGPEPAVLAGQPGSAPERGRSRPRFGRYLVAAAAVALLLVVALTQLGREESPPGSPVVEDDPVAEAMRAFRPLLVEASLELDPGD